MAPDNRFTFSRTTREEAEKASRAFRLGFTESVHKWFAGHFRRAKK